MPVLLAILGMLGAAAFWYYRLRDVGHVAGEVIDAAQRARGTYRRKQFRKKAESSAIEAVDDPAAAAVAMLIGLASERGDLSLAAEEAIKAEMQHVMGLPNIMETFTFAEWVAGHATDPNTLSLKFSKLWVAALEDAQRADIYDMAKRVTEADGEPTASQIGALRALRDRLGLTRT
ncbi:hypothetical protein DC522_01720 [Microvirga sp. KLBC 81]|uniref:hypothetical protein n=1 Tax=Microvirga sp. KLBC 81 TaxID=1862707 RepID=UPI000D50A4EF|nr:hypothetical protein [Microvirga sp. KLBC 81]PVE25982.1 hypothetical protein DC522_01720 [Microvirga sp. KLBC 81]